MSSAVRRSISCYNLPAFGLPGEDFFIDDQDEEQSEQRRQMFEVLRAKKESLDLALKQKLAELKAICLQEAVSILISTRDLEGITCWCFLSTTSSVVMTQF